MQELEKRVAILEHQLALSQRNRARLEDVREKNQRMLETANEELAETVQELRRAQASLIQSEKMAALGQLTGGIAHEIKNPLNFVKNFAELTGELLSELVELMKDPLQTLDADAQSEAHELLETLQLNLGRIGEHGARANQIVSNMLAHSHQGPGEARLFDFNDMLEESMQLAYHGARAKDSDFFIDMRSELQSDVGRIEGFPQELSRVFLNLITNGFYAATKHSSENTL
ncbi:MAG: sensor histidine kinase, partial [Longimicrobiales bacterium]